MFAGRFKSTIDKKGRVVVPKALRALTPDTMWTHAVLTSGLDECLCLYVLAEWERLMSAAAVQSQGLPDVELMLFQRLFAGSGHVVEADQFSRIVVPQELREEAGLDGECVWLGAVNRAELWCAERWNAYRNQNRNALKEIWDRISQRSRAAEAGHAQAIQRDEAGKP